MAFVRLWRKNGRFWTSWFWFFAFALYYTKVTAPFARQNDFGGIKLWQRVYNFSAGPSMLFEQVLRTAQSELMDYGSSGQSVMEMSHRSSSFEGIIRETEASLRRVLGIPEKL